ncbi:MAG: glycosidase [Bacteroidetes bacterium]|nr:glycosidase [Bacteroidota bacterium]
MVLKRYENNPILTGEEFGWDTVGCFNPGAIKVGDEYIMIADTSQNIRPYLFWVLRSKDGINWTPDKEPLLLKPMDIWPEECDVYDPRITQIDGTYYITHSSHSAIGVRVALMKTDDFKTFERVGIISELGNRNAAIFPEKINGLYCRLDRPSGNPDSANENNGMWMSFSPDLIHWGQAMPVMDTRKGFWDDYKIGAGAIPIKVKEGWLEIYHGVTYSCNGYMYSLGACILDEKEPWKVLARTIKPILVPNADYEKYGRVPNVVFTCNAIVEPDGEVKIYYGCADNYIGLATAQIDDIIKACYEENPYPYHHSV